MLGKIREEGREIPVSWKCQQHHHLYPHASSSAHSPQPQTSDLQDPKEVIQHYPTPVYQTRLPDFLLDPRVSKCLLHYRWRVPESV